MDITSLGIACVTAITAIRFLAGLIVKAHGQRVTEGHRLGDILFMRWGRDSGITEHVGIIDAAMATYVITYEGNTSLKSQANGGCVMERNRTPANITGTYCPWHNM